ncbi:MAG: glucose-6-phosphate dehydrogenase [Chloroflexota bacterium]
MTLQTPEAQDFIIVGATGDLSQRKLLPALYNLATHDLLPPGGRIIGMASREWTDDTFREMARQAVEKFSRTGRNERAWSRLAARLFYVRADDAGYAGLRDHGSQGSRVVYLAIPPSAAAGAVARLGDTGAAEGTSIVLEKPFGRDLESCRALNEFIHHHFDESHIFRIDHYLGKETVQNILVFRFANSMFERVWNRDAIDHVQITVAESIGMEGRGAFYEEVGALRDVVQNHVLQVLSLLAMEPPITMAADAIHEEKAKVLHAMLPMDPAYVVRGQYAAGIVDARAVPAYLEEPGVAPESETETFFAAQVQIDSWRWAGVPFYIRAGKRLPRRETEITVVFREAPKWLFEGTSVQSLRPNRLVLRLQPNEGISLTFLAKQPGPDVTVNRVAMDFSYRDSFMTEPAEAYERLLLDAMHGDHTLFLRGDNVERAWSVVEPLLRNPPPLFRYPAGTWGPAEADHLISPPREWHLK